MNDSQNTFSFTAVQVNRFWTHVNKREVNECWEWTAARDKDSYGVTWANGHSIGAHRMSWIIFNGAIPNGVQVLHKCDNPPCVNPNHLWAGTDGDNKADKISKQRQARGVDQYSAKLDEAKIREIRIRRINGETLSSIAASYSVTVQTVWKVVKRILWNHV